MADSGGDGGRPRPATPRMSIFGGVMNTRDASRSLRPGSRPPPKVAKTFRASTGSWASICDFKVPSKGPPPTIRIERAKSDRATCKCVNPKREDLKQFSCPGGEAKSISQGSLRCGVLNSDWNNTYWQWKHLECWRVPERVYKILPKDLDDTAAVLKAIKKAKGVVISMDSFEDKDVMKIVAWVKDRANWANHNAEGLCYRGPNKVTTKKKKVAPAKKKMKVAPTKKKKKKVALANKLMDAKFVEFLNSLENEELSEDEGFEALAALDKGNANADELGLGRAKGPITPEKAKKKAKKALA